MIIIIKEPTTTTTTTKRVLFSFFISVSFSDFLFCQFFLGIFTHSHTLHPESTHIPHNWWLISTAVTHLDLTTYICHKLKYKTFQQVSTNFLFWRCTHTSTQNTSLRHLYITIDSIQSGRLSLTRTLTQSHAILNK